MAEEIGKNTTYEQEVSKTEAETETEPKTDTQEGTMASTDRGLFDFMKKKEDDKSEEVVAAEFENKVNVSEVSYTKGKEEEEEKKHKGGVSGLVEKLHRSDSSSSSSSDDEGDDEEKKKKKKEKKEKKGLKDKIKEKLPGGEDDHKDKEDPNVPIEKYHDDVEYKASSDKKEQGFLDKIKEKLPGGQQKKATAEDEHFPAPAPPPPVVHATEPCTTEGEAKEKKGFLDKIKEKIPGFHSKNGDHEEKKEEIKRESE